MGEVLSFTRRKRVALPQLNFIFVAGSELTVGGGKTTDNCLNFSGVVLDSGLMKATRSQPSLCGNENEIGGHDTKHPPLFGVVFNVRGDCDQTDLSTDAVNHFLERTPGCTYAYPQLQAAVSVPFGDTHQTFIVPEMVLMKFGWDGCSTFEAIEEMISIIEKNPISTDDQFLSMLDIVSL